MYLAEQMKKISFLNKTNNQNDNIFRTNLYFKFFLENIQKAAERGSTNIKIILIKPSKRDKKISGGFSFISSEYEDPEVYTFYDDSGKVENQRKIIWDMDITYLIMLFLNEGFKIKIFENGEIFISWW